MAITTPIMYNNMYCGSMNEQQINMILNTREQEEIPNLRKMVFDFSPEIVMESIEKFQSPRQTILDKGEKLEDYLTELRKYQTVGTAFMYFSPTENVYWSCTVFPSSSFSDVSSSSRSYFLVNISRLKSKFSTSSISAATVLA